MRIEAGDLSDLRDYESVPIGFWVEERFDPRTQKSIPVDRFWKDYDEFPDSRPINLSSQYSTNDWLALRAHTGDELIGGAIVAWNSDYEMLEGRSDLAVLVDLRVAEEHRRAGVGSELFDRAVEWAWSKGCTELLVETQDINVVACRFYASKGCELIHIDPDGYEELDEVKLIWRIAR